MNPTTCDTAYFGGIEIIMWTWSASKWPSSIRHSFCSASLRNTSPKCFRRLPYSTFLRHFGINTTWYLHSHFEWLKLSNSSIQSLLEVCLAAHLSESLDGLPQMSNCYCLPGRAGGSPDCSRCLVSPYAQRPVDYRSNCDEPLCLRVTTGMCSTLL